jgi:hypothetical protein
MAARWKTNAWYAATDDIIFPTGKRPYETLVAALKERLHETEIERLPAESA